MNPQEIKHKLSSSRQTLTETSTSIRRALWENWFFAALSGIAILLVIALSWRNQKALKEEHRRETRHTLQTVLESTSESMIRWFDERYSDLDSWVMQLNSNPLAIDDEFSHEITQTMAPLIAQGQFLGYYIVNDEGRIVLSNLINLEGLVLNGEEESGFVKSLFKNPAFKSLLLPHDHEEGSLTMSVNEINTAIMIGQYFKTKADNEYALILLIDPEDKFTQILQKGRVGHTGESYAINRCGVLISESRYDDELKKIGLIGPGEKGVMNVEIRDPGYNMVEQELLETNDEQYPLTKMAQSLTEGHSGINLDGYNDYRGVPVLGTWVWNEQLGFGIACEIDVEEAYESLRISNQMILFSGGLSISLILLLTLLFLRNKVAMNRANSELRESRKLSDEQRSLLSSTIESLTHPFYVIEAESFDVIISNSSAREKLVGESHCAAIVSGSKSDKESELELCNWVIENGIPVIEQKTFYTAFNEPVIEEIHAYPRFNSAGEVTHVIEYIQDITERKENESRMLQQKAALEASTNAVLITKLDGTIQWINPAFTKLTGYAIDEVLGKTPNILRSMKNDPQIYADMWNTILAGNNWHGEIINRKKDGTEYFEELSIDPIFDDTGEMVSFVAIMQDISERKQTLQALSQAKEIAEDAARSKSNFLANMSHEIRTPMNAIIGMTYLCLGTDLNNQQKDYIEKVYHSAQSLLGIINDILDFSKIEAGKMELEQIPFQLDTVFGDLSNLIAVKAQEKGLELLFDTHSDLPHFLIGDPLRFRQILLNLTGNALKFTEIGEIIIQVEPVTITNNEAELKISVKDTGIGMSPEQCERLFQSFSQADESTTRKFGGTGLGLAISKDLTELMGGTIWVESELGVGSSFIFTARFGIPAENKQTIEQEIPDDLKQLKVLVVDDCASSRDIFKHTLTTFSFDVTCVGSGEEAIELLEASADEEPFQLVLMDWKMPQLDGIETARLIKDNPAITNVPTIIMVTAYGRETIVEEINEVGLEAVLVKPITPSTLLDTIMILMGNREGFNTTVSSDESWKIHTQAELQGALVLLVEDNRINQQIAQELLQQAGVEVVCANNGKEALNCLENYSFELILMDVQMPEMDGYEASRTIRKNANYRDLPIIAMTANAMVGDREKCLEAGMNDHIAKPIDPIKLLDTLRKWIGRKKKVLSLENDSLQVQDSTDDILLLQFNSIDTEEGLRGVGGNRKLYLKLLLDFYNDQRFTSKEIFQAIENNDLVLALRIAHTIKGVSASIGAKELFNTAQPLEQALRNKDTSDYSSLCEALNSSLDSVLDELSILSANSSYNELDSFVEAYTTDYEYLYELSEELKIQLEEMNPEAEDTVAKMASIISKDEFSDILERINRFTADYDFKSALTELKKITATQQKLDKEGVVHE